MRLWSIAALILAGCGNVTEQTQPIGPCATSDRDWWPVEQGASWVYRVTDRESIARDSVSGVPPEVGWKEQMIMGVNVQIGGLAGDETGIRMRSVDELDSQWDYSHFVERGGSYRWVSKRIYSAPAFPPSFPLDDDQPDQERFYTPRKTRFDYSASQLCAGRQWHEEWEAFKYELYDEAPLPPQTEADTRPCLSSTWAEDPWACDPSTTREGSDWAVVAVDATVALFGGRRFYEHAVCLRRLDAPEFDNDSLYCWVRGVGKILECEVDHFSGDVIKVEELCLHCPTGEDCEWTAERADREGVAPPPLCNQPCLPCPEGEDCDWTPASGREPPACLLRDNWDHRRCEDALLP